MSYHQFSMAIRKATKPHHCIWCGEAIPTGTAYNDERSVYDGSFQKHRWHPECLDAAQQDWADGGDSEFIPRSNDRPTKDLKS